MAFVNKFKAANAGASNPPPGVKIENTSFGQTTDTYTKPQLPSQVKAHQKGKPRGGWDDEDEPTLFSNNKPAVYTSSNTGSVNTTKPSLSISTGNRIAEKPTKALQPSQYQESYKKLEVLLYDDNFTKTHEYEIKVIDDLIQPGGARLRQPDALLNDFCKAADSLQVEVVGSLLLHNLTREIVWISKARAIFTIETLAKKVPKYYEFFRRNIKYLRRNEFENDGANATQLTRFADEVIDYLEDPERAPQQYAQSATSSNKKPISEVKKNYSQSAAHPLETGTLSTQLISTSEFNPEDNQTVEENILEASTSDRKVKNDPENSPEKSASIMDSLAGLNFAEEQPNEEKKKIDELYELYNNVLPNPMPNIGGPTPYANMAGPNGMGPYGPGSYNHPGHNGYPNPQFYNPQVNPHYAQYNPHGYPHPMQGYSRPMGYPGANQYANQYNNGQYNMQSQQMNVEEAMLSVMELNPEELKKKKQQEEVKKRFDSLKCPF